MKWFRKIVLPLLLPLLLHFSLSAQILDTAALIAQPVYEDLNEALKNPDKVYRLSQRGQKLKEVPQEIMKFKNLQDLDLSRNKLKSIPETIGTLTNLQVLNVSSNQIETLPDSIGMLKNLKKLIAFKNNLIGLPKELGNCENLEVLDLWSNDLAIFPPEISKLKKLRWVDMRVILLNDEDQDKIRKLLPDTKIFFSPSCKCVTGG
jgi:Leucine-rich repeat (LRR) protein